MTKKQMEELLKELREIREALQALRPQPPVVFVPNPYPVPYTPPLGGGVIIGDIPGWGTVTCTNGVGSKQ